MNSDSEIRGDWSNLKGTEYHLVYAIWLLITEQATEVAFYEGNDLRAIPMAAATSDSCREGELVSACGISKDIDIWIQLKSSREPWSPTSLMEGTLLENFICNALTSRERQRSWECRLVSQGVVNRLDVAKFLADPQQYPGLNRHLNRTIESVTTRIDIAGGRPPCDYQSIRHLAIKILNCLSQAEPVALATLKAEIDERVAYIHPQRRAVSKIGKLLLGAMLKDAAAGPANSRRYDRNWINDIANLGLGSARPFDRSVQEGCDAAVGKSLPRPWNSTQFATRQRLNHALNQFIGGRAAAFILLGKSGAGKTWAMANWVGIELVGTARLFVTYSSLDIAETLDSFISTAIAPYSDVRSDDASFVAQFVAAKMEGENHPSVLVLDDVHVSTNGAESLRAQLGRVVNRARELRIKVVLTCQTIIWEQFRLWDALPASEIFTLDSSPQHRPRSSFSLDDFSPDEQRDALALRIPPERVDRACLQLRSVALLPLRNPYLLSVYLSQSSASLGGDHAPSAVDVDDLLRERVQQAVENSAAILEVDPTPVKDALLAVVGEAWASRPSPVPYARSIHAIERHLPSQGKECLDAFQRVGLVVNQGGVRIAEDAISDYLLAGHIAKYELTGVPQLVLDRDASLAAVLIRRCPSPAALSQQMIQYSRKWANAAALGLSQCSPDELSVTEMLVGLARDAAKDSGEDGRSLGLLATRGGYAWVRVLELYQSHCSGDRHIGEAALGATLEFAPEIVGDAVRKRIERELRTLDVSSEKDLRRLGDCLSPLQHVSHVAAATVARVIVSETMQLLPIVKSPEGCRVLDMIDVVRGKIAIFIEDELAQLFADLASTDVELRFRAAGALREIAYENPSRMQPVLFARLVEEVDPSVCSRLFWMATKIVEQSADGFLKAMKQCCHRTWSNARSAGPALAMLGLAAKQFPYEVRELLPVTLELCDAKCRAVLTELLAYAWWCVAEGVPEARSQLASLANVQFEGLSNALHTFILRGVATARLALSAVDRYSVDGIDIRMVMLRAEDLHEYLYIDLEDFVSRHAAALTRSADFGAIERALIDCVCANHRCESSVSNAMRNARYFAASDSLEVLAIAWAIVSDPVQSMNRLPRDWEALRATKFLLQAGRVDSSIVEFGVVACREASRKRTSLASDELSECLIQLGRIPGEFQAECKRLLDSISHSFFEPGAQSLRLTANVNDKPEEILQQLDAAIARQNDIPLLFDWGCKSQTWQAVVLSGLYARMFELAILAPEESKKLVQQTLAVVQSVPDSPIKAEYELVYSAILRYMNGEKVSIVDTRLGSSIISESHAIVCNLLSDARARGAEGSEWLDEFLHDRRGWWESTSWKLADGTFSGGSGLHCIYVYPAVRIAFGALGHRYGMDDPCAKFMQTRANGQSLIDKYFYAMRPNAGKRYREDALKDIESQRTAMPLDERLLDTCGVLLLGLGRFEEARDRFEASLRQIACTGESRGSSLYNLGCAEARLNREEACRQALNASHALRPLDSAWLLKDPDLESMRDKPWFLELAQSQSIPKVILDYER